MLFRSSAQTETPLLDLTAGGTSETLIESDNGTVSYTSAAAFNASTMLSVGNAIQPGTLSISVSGATLTDNGGHLMSGTTVVGTVNYGRGQIALASSASTYSGTKTISASFSLSVHQESPYSPRPPHPNVCGTQPTGRRQAASRTVQPPWRYTRLPLA